MPRLEAPCFRLVCAFPRPTFRSGTGHFCLLRAVHEGRRLKGVQKAVAVDHDLILFLVKAHEPNLKNSPNIPG